MGAIARIITGDPKSDLKANVKQALSDANIIDTIFEEDTLRAEIVSASGKNEFKFQILQSNATNPRVLERLLNVNDLAIVYAYRVSYGVNLIAAPGQMAIQTYPNIIVVPVGVLADLNDLYAFYNGSLKVVVGNVSYKDKGYPVMDCFVGTRTQETAANAQQSSYNQNVDGFVNIAPNLIFSGREQVQLPLTLPSVAGTSLASLDAAKELVWVLEFKCMIIRNGADTVVSVPTPKGQFEGSLKQWISMYL